MVGLLLFEQIGRKVYLTDTGRELYQTCRGILEHLSQFKIIAVDMKGMKAGKLRLAVVITAKYFTQIGIDMNQLIWVTQEHPDA